MLLQLHYVEAAAAVMLHPIDREDGRRSQRSLKEFLEDEKQRGLQIVQLEPYKMNAALTNFFPILDEPVGKRVNK